MPYTKKTGPFQVAAAHGPVPVRVHYITLVGTPGAIAVDYALSSPNVSAVRTNVGRYTISFPAGGGPPSPALGWTECGLLNPTVQGQLLWMWSANPQDFEGGHVGIRFLNAAGSGADLVGRATVNVFCLCDHTNN